MADRDPSDELTASWSANADAWTQAVRSGAIASRRLVTDRAVVDAVLRCRPQRVLDVGCGEGWLLRALAPAVREAVGVDASPELVARAEAAGGATVRRLSYTEMVAEPARLGSPFDAIVANFALLDQELAPLLGALRSAARPGGTLIIQTLHPMTAGAPYADGWRREDFSGFGTGAQWHPMPWYFRTLGSWLNAVGAFWTIARVEEPLHPETRLPASLLITATIPG